MIADGLLRGETNFSISSSVVASFDPSAAVTGDELTDARLLVVELTGFSIDAGFDGFGAHVTGTSLTYAALTPKGAAAGNIIAVSVYELGTNSDPYTYDQLQAEIDKLAQRVTPDPGEAERLQIAGKRSLKYVFDFGSATVINYFIFSGATELQVRCQWTTQKTTIERGCVELVNTLRIN